MGSRVHMCGAIHRSKIGRPSLAFVIVAVLYHPSLAPFEHLLQDEGPCDSVLGQILSHAPADGDGAWPFGPAP
jgi:hypothetical protein